MSKLHEFMLRKYKPYESHGIIHEFRVYMYSESVLYELFEI
jgi:hypothetical protein